MRPVKPPPRGTRVVPVTEALGEGGSWSFCRVCDIRFRSSSPDCPACESLKREAALRRALVEVRNQLERTEESARRMRSQVDMVMAMKEAVSVIGATDLAWLKSVLYRRREDPSLMLRILHGPTRGRGQTRTAPANGFILTGGDASEPETWQAVSVGAVAIAGYFEEALKVEGQSKAMMMLTRALSARMTAT